MSEIFPSRPRNAFVFNVTAASATSPVAPEAGTYRIISDRNVHVVIGSASTVSDMLVYQFHPIFISLSVGEQISAITATGEIAGKLWMTRLDRA